MTVRRRRALALRDHDTIALLDRMGLAPIRAKLTLEEVLGQDDRPLHRIGAVYPFGINFLIAYIVHNKLLKSTNLSPQM